MMALLKSEWERQWMRKSTWIPFLLIPLMVVASARYAAGRNEVLSVTDPEYATAFNFPVLAVVEMLIVAFNILLLMWCVLSVTQEWRRGQLRMMLLRPVSFGQVLLAKGIVLSATMALFLLSYGCISAVVGGMMFSVPEEPRLFYYEKSVPAAGAIGYVCWYYVFAFLSLMAIGGVWMLIALVSKTMTGAMGAGMGFLLASLAYPEMLARFSIGLDPPIDPAWSFFSLTHVQHMGIALLLGETNQFNGIIFGVSTGVILLMVVANGILAHRRQHWE